MNNKPKIKIKVLVAIALMMSVLSFSILGGIRKASAQTHSLPEVAAHNNCWLIIK